MSSDSGIYILEVAAYPLIARLAAIGSELRLRDFRGNAILETIHLLLRTRWTASLRHEYVCSARHRQASRDGIWVQRLLAYNNRAWSRAALGQLEDALADANASIKLKSDAATSYDTRAVIYILSNQAQLAVEDLNKAISLDDAEDGAYRYHRAIARRRVSDTGASTDASTAKARGYLPEPWEPTL